MHEGCCACLRPANEQEVRGLIVPTQSNSSCLSRGDSGIERRAKVRSNARIILLHFAQGDLRNRVCLGSERLHGALLS
mgnify:CR=1 FL=1